MKGFINEGFRSEKVRGIVMFKRNMQYTQTNIRDIMVC